MQSRTGQTNSGEFLVRKSVFLLTSAVGKSAAQAMIENAMLQAGLSVATMSPGDMASVAASVEPALRPFVGAQIGFQYGDVEDLFLGGPEGGIKYFVDENWFVFLEVAYLFFFEDVDAADDTFDDGKFVWGVGIGARLPGE